MSLPSRERGLKLKNQYPHTYDHFVAPFAGAWIEIIDVYVVCVTSVRRSLRGSVD